MEDNQYLITIFQEFIQNLQQYEDLLSQDEKYCILRFSSLNVKLQHVLLRMYIRKKSWFSLQDLKQYNSNINEELNDINEFIMYQKKIFDNYKSKEFLEFAFNLDMAKLKLLKTQIDDVSKGKENVQYYPPNFYHKLQHDDNYIVKKLSRIGDVQTYESQPKFELIFELTNKIEYYLNVQNKQSSQFMKFFQSQQNSKELFLKLNDIFTKEFTYISLNVQINNILEKSYNLYYLFRNHDLYQIKLHKEQIVQQNKVTLFLNIHQYQEYNFPNKIRKFIEENYPNNQQCIKITKLCYKLLFNKNIEMNRLGTQIFYVSKQIKIQPLESIENSRYEYTKILHFMTEFLEKQKKFTLSIFIYLSLLNQDRLQSKRGKWLHRALFLIQKYMNEKQLVDNIYRKLQNDPNIISGNFLKIQRIFKISFDFQVTHYYLKASVNDSVKKDNLHYFYMDQDDKPSKVERICLKHYKQLNFQGSHCENYILTSLYGLFFFHIIYQNNLNQFQAYDQTFPLDMFLNCFYQNRQSSIDDQLNMIENFGKQQLKDYAMEQWDKFEKFDNYFVSWNDSFYNKERLSDIASYFSGYQLRYIFEKFSQNLKQWRSGMPDLFLFRDEQIQLVEVKSENDRLSEQQIAWIQVFNFIELPYEICHISSKEGIPI